MTLRRRALLSLATALALSAAASAGPLDEMSLERWAKLREVERYQMQIAEKFYKQQNWKAALGEYEKYITLYEKSDAASYAQLKWALCQVRLRKANTAIKDGFQTVLDYWPDSEDAVLARYHMGRTWLDMGRLDQAKKAFQAMLKEHAGHTLIVHALVDLVDIAQVEKDFAARGEYWKKLTFDVKRTNANESLCRQAARAYAVWCLEEEAFDEAVRAFATSYPADDLPLRVGGAVCPVVSRLASDDSTRPKAQRLAAQAAQYLRGKAPQDPQAQTYKESLRRILHAVADVHASAGLVRETAETYEEIFKRCGVNDASLGRLAEWQESQDRFDEANKTYRRFADRVAGLSRVAAGYRKRKLYPAAIATYREMMSVEGAKQADCLAEIGATHRQAGQYAQAIEIYRELMKVDPGNTPQWLWMIGSTHYAARQWKEAIGVLRQCTNAPENLQLMALCHRHLKEFNEALILYNQIGSDPKHAPWAGLEIAHTWEEAQKKENAIRAFQQVCKLYPRSSQASTAHARLQSVYKITMTLGGATDE